MFHYSIHTEILIQAPAARVWQVLTDFASFSDWNPFIRRAEGQLRPGEKLEIHIQPGGSKPGGAKSGGSNSGESESREAKGMIFRPTVLAVQPERELRWLGHLGVPGVFDGEHRFALKTQPDGSCLFHHGEDFRGLLLPLLRKSLERGTRQGFEAMNLALKARAEGQGKPT